MPRPAHSGEAAILSALWRLLRHPGFALAGVALGLIVASAAFAFPQLPGQLQAEPVAASRWLQDAAARSGFWGNLALGLGLYNVAQSPLLYSALSILALAFAARLSDEIARVRQLRYVTEVLKPSAASSPLTANQSDGAVLAIPTPPTVYRQRQLHSGDEVSHAALRAALAAVQLRPWIASESSPSDHEMHEAPTAVSHALGLRDHQRLWLRLTGPIGMLLAIAGLWFAFSLGQQTVSPVLAPGDEYRALADGVAIAYQSPDSSAVAIPHLTLTLEADTYALGLQPRTTIAGADVTVQRTGAALWIGVSGETPRLVQPGRDRRLSSIGLHFSPDAGEESILLPDYSVGLRIVPRGNGNDAFVLELYRSEQTDPVFRGEIGSGESASIPLGADTVLTAVALPGVRVAIDRSPGKPLIWLGLILTVLGGIVAARRPVFAWIDIRPWPPAATMVTVHSSDESIAQTLLTELAPVQPTPSTPQVVNAP